ncbi:hypothetical protein GCM10011391_09250 [Pullulanibacillus camelliae]|uniref:Uncharacterized protein n=1 Tax=Pullulanibacillus camelliae TaxID=1707096 RepID=A0A8J2VJS7_9BACL|nr:hypothetical protein GCM10011391_09250 [Pullulanibacillus camelliae]
MGTPDVIFANHTLRLHPMGTPDVIFANHTLRLHPMGTPDVILQITHLGCTLWVLLM